MGNGMNKVVDGLYLGNIRDSENRGSLSQNGITHILSVYNNAKPVLEDKTYLCINAADASSQNLSQYFKECIAFIHECRLKGGSCLVHCLAGVSRSTTVVVAYLMTVTPYGWEECLTAVKAVRPFVGPNAGFQQQLQEYQTTSVSEVKMSNTGGRRLKQWLIEQIKSGQYSGLEWEDDSLTMFRIPWKHAGKQDYNQEVDASIFKAWAVFKGKFKEGEKAEPATWKTRLRCALNKSPDFEEVTDRSQLDISEPYKVYRIVPEEEQKLGKTTAMVTTAGDIADLDCSSAELEELIKVASTDDYPSAIKRSYSPQEDGFNVQASPEYWSHGSIPVFPLHHTPLPARFSSVFSQMMISFYYGGQLMHSTVTSHPEGCRISPVLPQQRAVARGYSSDTMQSVHFPPADLIDNERQRQVTCKLLGHLERGVLVRANREGVFIKRLCQSRVFWSGHGEHGQHHGPVTCKLERDAVVKIFDTGRFLHALQLHQEGQIPAPDPTVTLCFGEELHDLSNAKNKLILVQITAMNCQQLLEAVNMRAVQSYNHSPSVEMSDEMASDQMARIYQDLCSYSAPQRTDCYRDNMTITA